MTKMSKGFITSLFLLEQQYQAGQVSEGTYIQEAGKFLECSQPFGGGGEYICQACLANFTGWSIKDVFDIQDQI